MDSKPPRLPKRIFKKNGAGISPEFYATLGLGLETRQGVAYEAVEQMTKKYCPQAKTALDYGCGTGRSTQFLKQVGLEQVVGVDINKEMLKKAQHQEILGISYEAPLAHANVSSSFTCRYKLIESGTLPFKDETFDLTFSGIVFLEISSASEIEKVLKELKRVTLTQGFVMILTCTKEGYITDSDSFECLLSQKEKDNLANGDPVPTRVKVTGQEFNDYYWSDDFLKSAIQKVGLRIEEVNLPSKQHYMIYVCKKPKKLTFD